MKLRRKTDVLQPQPLFVVIFGEPGSWKSSTSFTMPGPCLHFDFDNGFHRTDPKLRPDSFEMSDWRAFYDYVMSRQFEKFIRQGGYKTVILDTIGTLIEDLIIPYLINEPGNATGSGGLRLDRWTIVSENFSVLKKRFQSLGLHICAVCHGKEVGENEKKWGLDVKGNTRNIIYRSCDMMGFTFPQGKKIFLDFNPSTIHAGKNMARLPVLAIPYSNQPDYDNFLAQEVVQACNKAITTQSAVVVQFNKALDEWRLSIQTCEIESELMAQIEAIKGIENRSMKMQVSTLMQERLADLDFRYDKGKGVLIKTNIAKKNTTSEQPTEQPSGESIQVKIWKDKFEKCITPQELTAIYKEVEGITNNTLKIATKREFLIAVGAKEFEFDPRLKKVVNG